MAVFFVKTETASAGPFTGIELREAAMAGILTADSIIGGGSNGPWFRAMDTGLFSEKKMPLPHPQGTQVPVYHVRGLSFNAQGPFKLRELIGFAARGMVHINASLQSNLSDEWFRVDRIPVLNACLTGDLVLIGADGTVVRRADSESKQVPTPAAERVATEVLESVQENSHLPANSANSAMVPALAAETGSKATRFVSSGSFADTPYQEEEQRSESPDRSLNDDPRDGEEEPVGWWRRRLSMPNLNPNLQVSRRMVIHSAILLLAVGGIGTAFSQYQKMGMRAERIIGTWIAEDATFAIAFRQDGSCSAFNTMGKSWSGQYVWTDREESGATFNQNVTSTIDTVDAGHVSGPVLPSDGFVRLRTSALAPSYIANHAVSDLFLRRDGDALMVGYLSEVNWSSGQKQMEAGWARMQPGQTIGIDVMSDLSLMEAESPPEGTSSRSRHVSQVVQKMADQYELGEPIDDNSATLCFSQVVDASYLLSNYGVPDEARPIYPFEQAELPAGVDLVGSQMVRYGSLQLILATDGTLQCAKLMQ